MAEHMQTIISTTSKEPGFLSQSTEGEYNVTKEMIEETQQVLLHVSRGSIMVS